MRPIRSASVAYVLVFCVSACAAAEPLRIVFLEWLPLYAHTQIVDALKQSLPADFAELERVCVFGNKEEAERILAGYKDEAPAVLVVAGHYLVQRARDAVPEIPRIALMAEGEQQAPHGVAIEAAPTAEDVVATAMALGPSPVKLALMYTQGYGPNEALVKRLAEINDIELIPIPIDPGFCRTDADFELALRNAAESHGPNLLFVPSDPNCDRFVTTIFRAATELNLVGMGSESSTGQGCALALCRDYQAVGAAAGEMAQAAISGTDTASRKLPCSVNVDRQRLNIFGIAVSPELEALVSR